MKSERKTISSRQLDLLANNPRTITKESLDRLCESIRRNGFWEHMPVAVEPVEGTDRFRVLHGNQRVKAMRMLNRYEIPCVIYYELTPQERDEIILRGNINNGEWDYNILQTDYELVDFEDIGLVMPQVEMPDAPDDTSESDNAKEDVKKRTPWGKAKDYEEPVCNMVDTIEIHALRGYKYVHSFKTGSSDGTPISELKKPENAYMFALKAKELITATIGLKQKKGWCIITTPKRRHKEKHFASLVCEQLSNMLGIPFHEDVVEAKNRARINPVFTLVKEVEEPNIIIYDDILTGGTTLYTTANLFPTKNLFLVVGINNHR